MDARLDDDVAGSLHVDARAERAGGERKAAQRLGPGVDVKASGYIVVEPSIHPSGSGDELASHSYRCPLGWMLGSTTI